MRTPLLAIAAILLASGPSLAAPPNPGPKPHNGCKVHYDYQFASRERFGNWAHFRVYQQQINCQPLYVGKRWCQFTGDRYPNGAHRQPYVWGCQLRPPAGVTTATRKQG